MNKKLISLILTISTFLLLVGCSKEEKKEISNAEIPKAEQTVQKGRILQQVLNKKYVHIVDDLNDTGSIYYFKDSEVVLLYGYHADIYKIKSKEFDDGITYNLTTTEFGEPGSIINCVLNITQNEDKTINMRWEFDDYDPFEDTNLEILTAKECVKSILLSNPSYEHDRDWNDVGLTDQLFNNVSHEISEGNL